MSALKKLRILFYIKAGKITESQSFSLRLSEEMKQYRITFQGQTLTVPTGTRLDDAAAQAGFDLRTHCGGAGTCGKCQVIANHQKVLACQTVVESDLDVIVPDSSLRIDEQNVVVQTKAGSATQWSDRFNPPNKPVAPRCYAPGFH